MSNASSHEEAQLLARITVLEHVVALIVRDSMMRGQRPEDVLAFGERVKAHLTDRTPSGASAKQLREAADQFFTAIASGMGSQDSR